MACINNSLLGVEAADCIVSLTNLDRNNSAKLCNAPTLLKTAADTITAKRWNALISLAVKSTSSYEIYGALLSRAMYHRNKEAIDIIVPAIPSRKLFFIWSALAQSAIVHRPSLDAPYEAIASAFVKGIQQGNLKRLREIDVSVGCGIFLVDYIVQEINEISLPSWKVSQDLLSRYVIKVRETTSRPVSHRDFYFPQQNTYLSVEHGYLQVQPSELKYYHETSRVGYKNCRKGIVLNCDNVDIANGIDEFDECFNIPNLESYNIQDVENLGYLYNDTRMTDLISLFSRGLTHLTLYAAMLNLEALDIISNPAMVNSLKVLQLIDITSCCEDESFELKLIELVKCLSSVDILVLKRFYMDFVHAEKLCKSLLQCRNLVSLDLELPDTNPATLEAASRLATLPMLTDIRLHMPDTPAYATINKDLAAKFFQQRILHCTPDKTNLWLPQLFFEPSPSPRN